MFSPEDDAMSRPVPVVGAGSADAAPDSQIGVTAPLAESMGGTHRWLLPITVVTMYISLGVILGFVQGGVGPVLRVQGLDLASMRWVFVLYVPFGVAMLWAPWVDAWQWPWLGRRTGWIATMQVTAVAATVAAAFIEPQPAALPGLMLLGLVSTACVATMDLALDALTVEQVDTQQRAVVAAAKMGGISIGSALGGGLLVAMYPRLGWQGTLLSIAGAMALAGAPVATLVSRDKRAAHPAVRRSVDVVRMLRSRCMRLRLLRTSLLTYTMLMLFGFGRLLLVDLGISLERLGGFLGTIAPMANAVACLAALFLMRKLTLKSSAWTGAGVCLLGVGVVLLGINQKSASIAMVGTMLTGAGAAGLYIVLGSLILDWATGDQAATDYATLYGLGRLLAIVALVALPDLIQVVGWTAFHLGAAVAFATAIWYFLKLPSQR
ncbi:MFS transporter [Verminephrobacter aporrectodeae subsp. tuberculatae]|nr:MFS transporter [Verminephrobacter aporrectodeae subsp. tuberculatae]